MKTHTKQNLIELLNQRDPVAFTILYNNYFFAISSHAKKIVRDKEEADDIAIDTFMKFWRSENKFESLQQLTAFLFITAKNASLDYLKHLKIKKARQSEIISVLMSSIETNGNSISENDINKALEREIEKLPKKSNLILNLFYREGFKINEIAQQLGISEITVRNQKSLALKRLRVILTAQKNKK